MLVGSGHVYVGMCVDVCGCVWMCVDMCGCVWMCVDVRMCVADTHIHAAEQEFTHTYLHTYIHIFIHT